MEAVTTAITSTTYKHLALASNYNNFFQFQSAANGVFDLVSLTAILIIALLAQIDIGTIFVNYWWSSIALIGGYLYAINNLVFSLGTSDIQKWYVKNAWVMIYVPNIVEGLLTLAAYCYGLFWIIQLYIDGTVIELIYDVLLVVLAMTLPVGVQSIMVSMYGYVLTSFYNV